MTPEIISGEDGPIRNPSPITAREIREIPGVVGVYEVFTDSILEFRTLWIKVAWYMTPGTKAALQDYLGARKAFDTFVNVVRFDFQMPKDVIYAYDH